MAERRMISKKITDTDAFLEMPLSSQALYFHLIQVADDEGFVANPNTVVRKIGANRNDYDLLIAKRFVIVFDTGICVIKHWRIHNYIQSDRFTPTVYVEERQQLEIKENKSYTEKQCIQNVYNLDTQYSIDKISLDEISLDNNAQARARTTNDFTEMVLDFFPCITVSDTVLTDSILAWLNYKKDKKQTYKESGVKILLNRLKKEIDEHGEQYVIDMIEWSMANNYQGLYAPKQSAKATAQKKSDDEYFGQYTAEDIERYRRRDNE